MKKLVMLSTALIVGTSCFAMDTDNTTEQNKKTILREKLKAEGIDIKYTRNLYRKLRESSNTASDKELIGYILQNHNWETLSPEQQDRVIIKIKKLDEINPSVKDSAFGTFNYLRGVGNEAPDEELLKYCLEQCGYKKWDSLSSETKQKLITRSSASSSSSNSSSNSSSFNVLQQEIVALPSRVITTFALLPPDLWGPILMDAANKVENFKNMILVSSEWFYSLTGAKAAQAYPNWVGK